MKKLLIGFLLLFAVSSTAYAGSMWGTYKGRPIVKVVVDGTEVQSAVPGQIIDGATMLPVRAISDAIGADVQWNQEETTATITTPPQAPQGLTLEQLNKIGESVGKVEVYKNGIYVGRASGFLAQAGVFVTNNHVGSSGDELRIDLDGKTFTVRGAPVFRDQTYDLYGVKIDATGGLRLNTDTPENEAHVYTIGFPEGKFTLAEGHILIPWYKLYTHDAPQAPGSSGGVLLNEDGEVIGISASGSNTVEYNHAVPSVYLKDDLDQLK